MAIQTVFKRYELKYMLTLEQKEKILEAISTYMQLDKYGRTTIRNIYFDTDSYRLIRRSIEKPAYKEKLRIRRYSQATSDSTVFVELKKKYEKVVYKRRLPLCEADAMSWVCRENPCPVNTQISREIDYFIDFYGKLKPTVFLSYEREAYYDKGGGRFPEAFDEIPFPDKTLPRNEQNFDFITPETPFSTRHFTVFFDKKGEVARTNTESIYAIDEDTAIEYAEKAMADGDEHGWISSYRYKIFSTDLGMGVVFVDGSMSRTVLMQFTTIAGFVLLSCAALVLMLIFLLSKKAVKPIAESYEKQKQFVTDANHELKTPLTLIMANVEIAELELGKNEWLDDIRAEGYRMTELVNQLVALSRMDEDGHKMNVTEVYFGELVADTVSEFEPLAKERGKALTASVDKETSYLGDEALLHRLVGILMDNAIKYCDQGGEISVTLRRGRQIVLTVENTYAAVGEIELNRLFDRFYRADKARKFTGGYGVGLSMAKAIVEKHKGEISAYKKNATHIGFKIVL